MGLNHCVISGNLGKDAELRRTQSGMAIASFSVAVSDGKKNQQTGEWETITHWIDCVMFGTRAEKLASSLSKGTKVAVNGKLRQSKWQDKDGNNRSKLEVVVDNIDFMSRKDNSEYRNPSTSSSGPVIDVEPDYYSSDCPF